MKRRWNSRISRLVKKLGVANTRRWELFIWLLRPPGLTPAEQQELAELDARLDAETKAMRAAGWRDELLDLVDARRHLAAQDRSRSDGT
jgi:hypothetical protein